MAEPSQTSELARIALLDESVIAGIAAGEVVERPASVVKELVENSLDAGARHVRVEYHDKGVTRIVVTDDGAGIAADQIELALTRHATSKIRRLDDLQSVGTFGFRGEALSSIAAASEVELLTATATAQAGSRVVVVGGRVAERSAAAARKGTTIDVRDLFGAVPARRKFLKTAATEAGFVTEAVRHFALARPDVHLTLVQNGRTVIDAAPVAGSAARMRQILGREVAASLVEVDARFGSLHLGGFVSSPGTAYGSNRRVSVFLGRRWVKDRLLFRSVMEGYETYLLRGRFPAAVLFLECEGGSVDVNVHPAKLEVRFAEPDNVRRFVAEAVRDALRRSASPLGRWGLDADEASRRRAVTPSANAAASGGWPATTRPGAGASRAQPTRSDDDQTHDSAIPGYRPIPPPQQPPLGVEAAAQQSDLDLGPTFARGVLGSLEVIGQVFDGYLVCEGDGELVLVDQHAAHERILFERLMAAWAERAIASQPLLLPLTVRVGAAGVEACEIAREGLLSLGWEIDAFGEEEVVVRAMPAMAASAALAALVEALVADLVSSGRALAAERLAEKVLATVACHSALRVGKPLDNVAARALLAETATVPFAASCPHGRPVARTLTRSQLERMFGR
ncbi:MAG: DNA mismatch repair endonuclease MutL [Deltaproteobacteria bacterium]|nr:DNA mismatch repair endonuclease MutL [Deltaproteobacteria bacterium]